MSSSETPPPGVSRTRLPFQPMPSPFSGNRGRALLFVAIAVACGCASAYMALVQHIAWTDMRVAGPAVGALWFALRLFMMMTPRT